MGTDGKDGALQRMVEAINTASWNPTYISALAAIFAALAGLLSAYFSFWPYWIQRRTRIEIEQRFGADMYTKEIIEKSTKYYVAPDCSWMDPSSLDEIRQALDEDGPKSRLFDALDRFLLGNTGYRYMLLLADSGMGKTSLVLNYYYRNRRRVKWRRMRIAVVYLGSPNALERISDIDHQEDTVIFLDAFDEDVDALADYRKRLTEIMGACERFKRVLITCRTQFFPSEEEIPLGPGLVEVGPISAGETGIYEFWRQYLWPLDDHKVKQFVRNRYPFWRQRERQAALKLVDAVPLLNVRPMLLAYLPDLLFTQTHFEYSFQIYEALVQAWYTRESRWVDRELLEKFSGQIAVDLFIHSQERGAERISLDEAARQAANWGINLEKWQIGSRTLLNRDSHHNYKFAHRSIMEFLCVKEFLQGDLRLKNVNWTDQMHVFLRESLDTLTPAGEQLPIAREVMLPRIKLLAADGETFIGEVAELLETSEQDVILLYERNFDQVQGIAYPGDILQCYSPDQPDEKMLNDFIHPALFIPENKPLDELINVFLDQKAGYAVVVDEYGGISGLVTLDWVLEALFERDGHHRDAKSQ